MRVFRSNVFIVCVALCIIIGCGLAYSSSYFLKKKSITTSERIKHFEEIKLNTEEPVEVLWSSHLIPRIKAENSKDLFYTLGAVQIHLRRSQLELYRKLSRGALSEMAGPVTIKIDKFLKTIDFDHAAQLSLQSLPQEAINVLQWMSEGMNDYIQQTKHKPQDLKIMGIQDELWTVLDLVRVYKFTSIDPNWGVLSQLFEFNNTDFVNQIWSLKTKEKDFFEDYIEKLKQKNNDDVDVASTKNSKNIANKNHFALLQSLQKIKKSKDEITNAFNLSFMEHMNKVTEAGSNAFAVQGSKTKTKAAIVSNDPHLGLMIPNIWLFVILDSPEYKTMGYLIPSFPVPAIGRNMNIAWGGTNLWGLSTYLTELSPEEAKHIQKEEKELKIRFWPDRKIKTYKLGKYPVLRAEDFPEIGKKDIVLRWQGYEPSDEIDTFLGINKAKNFQEFHQSFGSYGAPGMTFVYGDRQGNVGKVVAFSQPQVQSMKFLYSSKDFLGQTLNSLTLPSEYNPKNQFVVSANDYTKGLRQPMSLFQAPMDRRNRMTFLLRGKSEMTLEDVKELHKDVFSATAYKLKNDFVKHAHKENWVSEKNSKTFSILESWNGNYDIDSKGALVFEVIQAAWAKELIERDVLVHIQSRALKEKAFNFLVKNFNYRKFLSESLEETSFLTQQKFETYLLKAETILTKYRNWGNFHHLDLRHPLGYLKLFKYSYSFYDEPWAGGNETLMKAAHKLSTKTGKMNFGAQARWMTDTSSLNENYIIYLGGQDAFIGSENINNLTAKWKTGDYLRVPFEREEFKTISASSGQ